MKTIAIGEGHNTPQDMGFEYNPQKDDWLIEFCENLKILPYVIEYLYKWDYRVEDFSGHLIREKIPFINTSKADFSVEIHHNANNSEKFRGAEVIYHPKSIQGKKAAQVMLDAIKKEGFEIRGIFEGWWRYNPKSNKYYAFTSKLWKPSVIVECAYFTNQTDRNVISYFDYPHDMGLAIAKGIKNYVEN